MRYPHSAGRFLQYGKNILPDLENRQSEWKLWSIGSGEMGRSVQTDLTVTAEPVVTILFKNCNQYRVPFFRHLRRNLEQKGIELRLVVGGGLPEDLAKGDIAADSLPWAEERPFRSISVLGHTMLWQPGFDLARSSDCLLYTSPSPRDRG